MMQNKYFWLGQNLFLLAVYACGIALLIAGRADSIMVLICAALLGIHVLEIPLAIRMLRDRDASPLRLLIGTLLFGFTWWLPARNGVYAAR